jgi:hypothetical protein
MNLTEYSSIVKKYITMIKKNQSFKHIITVLICFCILTIGLNQHSKFIMLENIEESIRCEEAFGNKSKLRLITNLEKLPAVTIIQSSSSFTESKASTALAFLPKHVNGIKHRIDSDRSPPNPMTYRHSV